LKEFVDQSKTVCNGIDGIEIKGWFVPAGEWNYAVLLEAESYDKVLELHRTNVGPAQLPIGKQTYS